MNISLEKEINTLEIKVIDDGNGFSKDTVCHAKEQFYMEDQNRNNHMHFGMGLYIANCIAQQHEGEIRLENDDETGGVVVTIRVQS